MKIFIIFTGMLIVNVSFLSYQGDLWRYLRCQEFLKATAEECAAGAALFYDEAAYSNGEFRFKYEEGLKYIEYILEKSRGEMPLPQDSIITCNTIFQDDLLGYEGGEEAGGAENIPSVTVEVTAVTGDLFRLPFLEVTEIKRAAKYELPQ